MKTALRFIASAPLLMLLLSGCCQITPLNYRFTAGTNEYFATDAERQQQAAAPHQPDR